MENTVNLNASECIKKVTNITHNVYMNICNNTSKIVEHGTMDLITHIFIVIALIFSVYVMFRISTD